MTYVEILREMIRQGKHSDGSAIAWLMKNGNMPLPQAMKLMQND